MTYLRCDSGSVFRPEELAVYYEKCPICSSQLVEFKESEYLAPDRNILRICWARPANRNIIYSHIAKSHYHEELKELHYKSPFNKGKGPMFDHTLYIRQQDTHSSKWLININYNNLKDKKTNIRSKHTSATIVIPGWWNPGSLKDDYKSIYSRAKRLSHLA